MTAPSSSLSQDPSDRLPYGAGFVCLVMLLVVLVTGLEVALVQLIPREAWIFSRRVLPVTTVARTLGSGLNVSPGNAAVWNGELWAAVGSQGPAMRGLPAPTSVGKANLIAFDLKTGTSRDTGLTVPAPSGMLNVNEQLWIVSNTGVYRVDGNQVLERHPRRGLVNVSVPFPYQGQMAVIDRNKDGIYTLLTWNEGEWDEVARIDLPEETTYAWFTPQLRVIADDHSIYPFYYDGNILKFREGLPLDFDRPVSALEPANQKEIKFKDPRARIVTQIPAALIDGWRSVPLALPWGSVWDVGLIDGELWAFGISSKGSFDSLQRYKYRDDSWAPVSQQVQIASTSFAVCASSPGYIVADEDRLLRLDGTTFQRVTATPPTIQYDQNEIGFLTVAVAYVSVMLMLCLGVSVLMHRYRDRQYCYGKRLEMQASIWRRGIARGIDSALTILPAAYWFAVTAGEFEQRNQMFSAGERQIWLFWLFSDFGLWVGSVLFISVMQGLWGVTPGKWLCGIRTLRTTLRPCGVLRAVTRELAVYIDSLLLITWAPGVISIALTRNWQRLGDLAAETIVVRFQPPSSDP